MQTVCIPPSKKKTALPIFTYTNHVPKTILWVSDPQTTSQQYRLRGRGNAAVGVPLSEGDLQESPIGLSLQAQL